MKKIKLIVAAIAVWGTTQCSHAQKPELHVSDKWRECSFQLDQSLTQSAWRVFTKEAGAVIAFRPLVDAKPMGARKFEFSILQWNSKFDDSKPAWNDTFVHPSAEHWLKEKPRLPFPGLTFRGGITNKLDAAVYWTKSFGANYGLYGAQLQYNLLNKVEKKWAVSVRGGFNRLYGPKDLSFTTYGLDGIVSKEFALVGKWLSVAPYAGVSTYLSASHEKSDVVDLKNEQAVGVQSVLGAVAKISFVRLAFEYNYAQVNTISFKLGATF